MVIGWSTISHEVRFTFSLSRGMHYILNQLVEFDGTLVTNGYGAYKKFSKRNSLPIPATLPPTI
jgi:hypothetical protein